MNKWDFVYDEDYPDDWGRNFTGILSDGRHFLFWHALAENEGDVETCRVYDSIESMFCDNDPLCEYKWTAENDSILLECLNGLDETDIYVKDALRKKKSKDAEEE